MEGGSQSIAKLCCFFSFFQIFFQFFFIFFSFWDLPLDLSENYVFFNCSVFFSFWDPPPRSIRKLWFFQCFQFVHFFLKMWVPAQDPCLQPLEQVASTYQH